MEEVSGQEFFEQHGYYPTTFVPRKPRPITVPVAGTTSPRRSAMPWALALRGWRAPLHWTVPPAFENPGFIYQEVGHEAFCELVKDYYSAIGQLRFEQARQAHTKWAIRAFLRTFETHVRGFRRQDVSRRGSIFATASDELTLPEDLVAKDEFGQYKGRLMAGLQEHLRAYGVPEAEWSATEQVIKAKLGQTWGVQC